jgi:hypothetical protein
MLLVWLYILCGVLLLFLLVAFIKITVYISFANDLRVFIRVLFFKIRIYPFKEEKVEKKPVQKKKPGKIKEAKPPRPRPPLKETLLLVKELVTEILGRFGRYIRIEEYRVKVLVATDDPAKTGVLYGAICGVLGSISVMIYRIKRRTRRAGRIYTEVNADFVSEEYELFLSVALSMRVWQLFIMGITVAKGLIKYNSLTKAEKSDT